MGFGFLSLAVLLLFFVAPFGAYANREAHVGPHYTIIALVLGSVCAVIAALFGFGVLT